MGQQSTSDDADFEGSPHQRAGYPKPSESGDVVREYFDPGAKAAEEGIDASNSEPEKAKATP